MTEAEWESGSDPDSMLRFVRGKVSDRKLRLFAAASFRRLIALLPDPRQRRGIDVLEQVAEGAITLASCRDVATEVRDAIPPDDWVPGTPPADHLHYAALMLYREFRSSSIAVHAVHAPAALADGTVEQQEQARLMRCIFGNPFRPVRIESRWVTPTVVSLAETIYEERAFDRLPALAGALEEAGCDDSGLLTHCRGEGPHARGCWATDLILGSE
jgi:hypothetical protein